ncbi:MAG TPA: peptidyl-prolyl cis-trans isomerase [Caulobacteraceae bacterium]|nr:peptidyl-prolyl cis-trans isomerase [Caulobacteraceae bacterium]
MPKAKPDHPRRTPLLARLPKGPQRPVALLMVTATIGMAAGAAGVLRPAHRDLTYVPPGDVALVNQEPILMSDFMTETQAVAGVPYDQATPAQRAQVLHQMVDQELEVQRGLALDLPEQDTDVRTVLVDSVNSQASAAILATRPTDDQLRAYFNAHQAKYATEGSMTVTDLVLHVGGFENADQTIEQAMADAEQAAYELRSGSPVAYVEQHFGLIDSGKGQTEDPDFAAKIHLGPKLFAVASAMSNGEISEPVADKDGVHILVMHDHVMPIINGFDKVRNNVFNDYTQAEKAQAIRANLALLRRKAQIILASGQSE